MEQDYTDIPAYLMTKEGEAASSNFSVTDYGRVGDQQPYQIVLPSYPAPQFLQTYSNLNKALRECGTLCQLSGKALRLVKWGSRLPCLPCGPKKRLNKLPSLRVRRSPGALEGYPDASPVADMSPSGRVIVYGPDGTPQIVGAPNYVVSRDAWPAAACGTMGSPGSAMGVGVPGSRVRQRYIQAVQSAQYLANAEGKQAYVCSGFGADCKGRNPKKWVPVVYVQPGGLVRRYADDMPIGNASSIAGSTNVITRVTPGEYQNLVAQSDGGSFSAQGQ